MMKVVINKCYGGFSLSDDAFARYLDLSGITYYRYKDERFGGFIGDLFYKVPKEEYDQVHAECVKRGNFKEANALYLGQSDIQRHDPVLVQVVEEMGETANGKHAQLNVVQIPDDVVFRIEEYDGKEWIAEVHRTWE